MQQKGAWKSRTMSEMLQNMLRWTTFSAGQTVDLMQINIFNRTFEIVTFCKKKKSKLNADIPTCNMFFILCQE